MKQTILIVDDEPATRFGFSRYLTKQGYRAEEASSLAEAREATTVRRYDAVLLDQLLPDGRGVDWIPELRAANPEVAIIVITGAGDIPLAVEAMRRGADNFLTKPVNMADLEVFLGKSLELSGLRRKDRARLRLAKKNEPYLGQSKAAAEVLELSRVAAENDSAVLLLGETGSGKGVVAQWIHEHGTRGPGPFVEVNCSGLRGELLASELFGHTRGAFTSASQDRQGLLDVADGGSLFLDEIGDMDPAVQAQFLKVIEEKSYRRLGEVKVRTSDFRLICATNKDLAEESRQGRFRQDLYYRIQVFPILVPPLRERQEDLPGLVLHVLGAILRTEPVVSPEVLALLRSYAWPGNVRELRNVLERAVLLARGLPLGPKHFPGLDVPRSSSPASGRAGSLGRMEHDQIKSVLERCGGDVDKASAILGISRATLYRKLKKMQA